MKRLFSYALSSILILTFLLGASSCKYIDLVNGKGEPLKFISNGDGTCTVVGNRDDLGVYTAIKKIEIPAVSPEGEIVTIIGEYAFAEYMLLEDITIPNSVISIHRQAFDHCGELTAISIPESVSSIDASAFSSCDKLANIEVSENNAVYTSIDGNVYSKDAKTLCRCAPAKISIDIPDSVTEIDNDAFGDCDKLAIVVLSDDMTSIKRDVFQDCTNLMSITVAKNITSIEDFAFFYCNKIVEIINHSSLNIKLDNMHLHGDIAEHAMEIHTGKSKLVNQDNYMFYTYDDQNYLVGYVGKDSKLELPGNYKGQNYAIYDNAFADYWGIYDVVIPEGVTSIGDYAFSTCYLLKNVTIPKSVKSIGRAAFLGCTMLEKVTYRGTVEEWNNISFGLITAFDSISSKNLEIVCSDGTIKI